MTNGEPRDTARFVDKDPEVQRMELFEAIERLSDRQLGLLTDIAEGLGAELTVVAAPDSDFANDAFMQHFGDILRVHHTLSRENFSKDKFEHAMESALHRVHIPAKLAPRGNHGHDIRVRAERWSLKTQADSKIHPEHIHISKFMEMGRGQWVAEADLSRLRDQMFEHMQDYDRIFTLRTLTAAARAARDPFHLYELVEIPKSLLLLAEGVPCVMSEKAKGTARTGSCTVQSGGQTLFKLYFDGGTERKLQIKNLAKSACRVHATWRFPRIAPPA